MIGQHDCLCQFKIAVLGNIRQIVNFENCYTTNEGRVKDEINVPIALSAFRDKGSRLWSF